MQQQDLVFGTLHDAQHGAYNCSEAFYKCEPQKNVQLIMNARNFGAIF